MSELMLFSQLSRNSNYQLGTPQRSGIMTMVPIFGGDHYSEFVGPMSGLKVSKVAGYGNLEIANPGTEGIAIVPLHLGYIQDGAQNHALCRVGFLDAGQSLMFADACCVQQSQGGYLQSNQQWFFILPLMLRDEALSLRGVNSYSKLWEAIARLNTEFGLGGVGHLEQIVSRKRAFLTQYQSRFELVGDQVGALFFLGNKLVGIEIAPNPLYFIELWMGLVCFCYGVAAMKWELNEKLMSIAPFEASSASQLRSELLASRASRTQEVGEWLTQTNLDDITMTQEEEFLRFSLETLSHENFAGQVVKDRDNLVYASVFAKPKYFANTP